MVRIVLVVSALTPFAATAATPTARIEAPGIAGASWATDRIEVQLRPRAAHAARAMRAAEAARVGWTPTAAAHTAAPDVAVARLGIASIDREASAARIVSFEPEFRAEAPPADGSEETDFTAFYIAHLERGASAELAAARLAALADVASAERIALLPVSAIPSDSLFSQSWWFYDRPAGRDMFGPEAWDVLTGDTAIVVGVLDTGVLPYHPDLGGTSAGRAGQIWTNAIEAAGIAGVDDDGNGFIDDVHGWDFVNRPGDGVTAGEDYADQDNDPNDFAGHGTAVAGVIGAIADNGIGVTGTIWKVRIMPLRIGWSADGAALGLVDMSYVAQALRYGARNGASVLNCSFATLNQSGLFAAASATTRAGVTIVAAAGNGGQPHDLASRSDVIAVAATGRNDVVAGFSNRGSYVDLAAPGVGILSTFTSPGSTSDSIGLRQPAYVSIDGTSFSAPFVAGAAALVQAQRRANGEPPLSPLGMLLRLSETITSIEDVNPGVTGYGTGRLNLVNALTARPMSTATRTGSTTVGAPVVLQSDSLLPAVAYLTNNQQLMMMAGQTSDTLSLTAIPARPLGSLAGGFVLHPIVVPAGSARAQQESVYLMYASLANGRIAAFNDLGNPMPGWPVVAGGVFNRPLGGPALGDLDGDGTLEVVCALEDGNVLAWHWDGRPVEGFPAFTSAAGVTAPIALADFDGDGAVEIVAAGADGEIHLLGGDGVERAGWPITIDPSPVAPVVTRFSVGGGSVIVVAAGSVVHAFSPDGSERFATALSGNVIQDPALGDVDGVLTAGAEPVDEIVLALDTPAIAVLDSAGSVVNGTEITLAEVPQSAPLIASLTTSTRDILVRVGQQLVGMSTNGFPRGAFPKPGNAGLASTLIDIDHDQNTEVLAGTGSDSVLYVYDAGDASAAEPYFGWPTTRGDFARTGSRDIGPPSPVRDLRLATTSDSTIAIVWSAPGNEGAGVLPVSFELKIARDTLTDANFDAAIGVTLSDVIAAGEPRVHVFTGLERGVRYVFALKTTDAAGNRSRISNIAAGVTRLGGPLANRPGPGIAPRLRPSRLPVQLYWRGAGGNVAQSIELFDVTGRRLRSLDAGSGPDGLTEWNGRDARGVLVPAGLYFARLISGSVHVQTRVVLLP